MNKKNENLLQEKEVTPDRETAIKLFKEMLLIRRLEEKAAQLYTQEKIRGFLHLYVGEEAVATGLSQCLSNEDYVLSTYREHGHAIARGIEPKTIMSEMFGKKEGCSRGRGGSMHLFDRSKNFYGGNAIVASHLPLALGMALAVKKQKTDRIVCCFFGEGAAAEGEFHEVMNLSSLWQVPLLLVCENNLYAMGTAIRYTHAMQQLEKKGESYGVESMAVDGMDVWKVIDAAKQAVNKVRTSGKPFFLVCNTYRFRAHSMFDAELYRDRTEVEEWKKKDPILKLEISLKEEGILTESDLKEATDEIEKIIDEAVDCAEKGSWESVEELTRFVYSEQPSP